MPEDWKRLLIVCGWKLPAVLQSGELENLTVVSRQGEYFRLGEIADISESYVRPARNLMKVGNVPAVGIAISTVSDGNVVEMAELVANRVSDLREEMPDGYTPG